MKLKHLFLGSLMAAAVVSCSEDKDLQSTGPDLQNETTSYIKLSLVGGSIAGRAATDYEDGDASENKVNSVILVFYDAARNFVATKEISGDKFSDAGTDYPHTVEKVLTTVAEVSLPENINFPSYVIAYVNPTTDKSKLAVDKLEDAMNLMRVRSSVSPDLGTRTMNNSMYFNAAGYTRFATEVNFQTQFFKSQDEAEKAKDGAIINITVERVEAKVAMAKKLSQIDITPVEIKQTEGTKEVTYSLKFVPETWFVNGTEKATFLLKNYRSDDNNYPYYLNPVAANRPSATDFGRSLATMTSAFNDAARAFNDPANLRSYWAIDPTYFFPVVENAVNPYPSVSYQVTSGTVNTDKNNGYTPKEYPLEYRSYNEAVADKADNYKIFEDGVKTHEYVLENTMNLATLTSSYAKAAISSVVIVGHYEVKKGAETVFDGTREADKNKAIYVNQDANGKRYFMIGDSAAINWFCEHTGSILYVQKRNADNSVIAGEFEPLRAAHLKENYEEGSKVDYNISQNDFELVYPETTLTNGREMSEQWRTLALKLKANGEPNENLYIFDMNLKNEETGKIEPGYRKITSADLKDINVRLYSAYGVIEKYQKGKAFFNVPLKHIWGPLTSTANEINNPKLGDYGLVRNHVYKLTVNKIEGLGTGIGDLDQPIVPPSESEKYFISAQLRILQWRIVNQSVDL